MALQEQIINLSLLKSVAVPIHILELLLSLFLCYMAIRFFRVTKPAKIFIYVYMASGFFVINSLLYILLYTTPLFSASTGFMNVYIGSRITILSTLLMLAGMFLTVHYRMRSDV